jgi:hypothetical protein
MDSILFLDICGLSKKLYMLIQILKRTFNSFIVKSTNKESEEKYKIRTKA